MAEAKALLVPSPHAGTAVGIPIDLELEHGAPPATLHYDGNGYRRTDGRGPEGEWLYEHLED